MATDPVCGMWVEERPSSLRLARDNRTYYFCSETCLHQFADPEASQRRLARRVAIAWPLALLVVGLTYGIGSRDALIVAAVPASVVQFYAGAPFYRGLRDAVVDRTWNMDVLIAVGSTAAYGYSVAVLLLPARLPPIVYFDASSLIVALILTGNYLEHLTRARSGSALLRLQQMLPTRVTIRRGGTERIVALTEVRPGDRVVIPPGERIAIDGVVRAGRGSSDESVLTGEAMPVEKHPGDRVLAGSVNGGALLEVEATAVGDDTFVGEVGRLLLEAEMARVPLQRTADRIAAWFVPIVLVLGLVAGVGWAVGTGAGAGLGVLVFVSVVIIACPCAFGIATPAAIVVGTGRAAEEGVLFRGEDAIERAAVVDLVVTDKTGTLTEGHPRLVAIRPSAGISESELLALAAAVEAGVAHPFAAAIRDEARSRGLSDRVATEVQAAPGRGVRGQVDGRSVEVLSLGTGGPASGGAGPVRDVAALDAAGASTAIVRLDDRVVGVLGFVDPVRPGTAEAIRSLTEDGLIVVMATGDREAPARTLAGTLGIREVHAGLDPEAKLRLIQRYRSEGRHVAFVGDGINDAAALSAADLGVAIGSGTDVAREAGQVVLVRPELAGLTTAIGIARRTVRKVRQNLAWALGYNAILLPVAAGALVPIFGLAVYRVLPVAGAAAMAASSTLVVLNSLSLRYPRTRTLGGASRPAAGAHPL